MWKVRKEKAPGSFLKFHTGTTNLTKSNSFNYSAQGDTFNVNGTDDGNGETFNETFKAPVTETDEYIIFTGHDGRFYKTYALAEAALNNR